MKTILSFILFIGCTISISAQQYKPIDAKSEIKFIVKNFGLNTPGTLSGLKGSIQFNPSDLSNASFNVSVDVNTINTGIEMRDTHLKHEEYFYTEKYPTISFTSTAIKANNDGYIVTGELTIKGISKNISFPFTAVTQNGGMLFTSNFSINRKDFDIGGSSAVLSNNVDISLKVYAQ
jgi:polyisoprenoid-binding protein YceI